MKTLLLPIFLLIFSFSVLSAQTDSTQNVDLLGDLNKDVQANKQELLPKSFLLTQRLLWGEKGVMRNFSAFELTPEKRENELKLRRVMLTAHQITGIATLGCMVAQGIVGATLYKDLSPESTTSPEKIRATHEALATAVNITYFTTAALALFAPPKMIDERKGYGSIKVHKALAIVHLASMIATNVLAGMMDDASYDQKVKLRPYHRAAAYTAFGSFAASMIILEF